MFYGFDFTNNICYIATYDGKKVEEIDLTVCPQELDERVAFLKGYVGEDDRAAVAIEEVDQSIQEFSQKLGPAFRVLSKEEAFGYYILGEDNTMWKRQNGAFEFHKDYFRFYEMSREGRILAVSSKRTNMEGISLATDKEKDKFFTKQSADVLNVRQINNVFLNGEEFRTEWMKLSLNALCAGRRVFAGNHLFATGALRSLTSSHNNRLELMTEDYHPFVWGIRTYHHGKKDVFAPIIQSGNFWFLTKGYVDVFVDECEELMIEGKNSLNQEKITLKLPLKFKSANPMRTTKLRIEISCTGIHTIKIRVSDMGFGKTRAGAGMIFEEEYKLPSITGR